MHSVLATFEQEAVASELARNMAYLVGLDKTCGCAFAMPAIFQTCLSVVRLAMMPGSLSSSIWIQR